SDRRGYRVAIPKVVPAIPVARRMAPVPASVPRVVIVEPVLPVLAGLVAMVLPILANLVAPALPILAHLAPVSRGKLVGPALSGQAISGQAITRQSVMKPVAPILEGPVCRKLTGAGAPVA